MDMADYTQLVNAVIKQQEYIIGPVAWNEARKVSGLVINDHNASVSGDGKSVLEKLVNQYATLFGDASVEVCKEAIRHFMSDIKKDEIPQILQ
jgi:thiamine phosphate synthase YjbQ (UPF0047 family)